MYNVRVLALVVCGSCFGVGGSQDSGGRVAPAPAAMENFRDLDGDEVLSKIARMPIREWNYKGEDSAIRHLGPAAQDFHAAFGLGESSAIGATDADGVALRAIQALEARTRSQHGHMLEDTQSLADLHDSLARENADRIAEVAALKATLAALRGEIVALCGMPR